jgi:hypothetical protein
VTARTPATAHASPPRSAGRLVVALQRLAIDQHRQAIFKTKLHRIGLPALIFQRMGHAHETKFPKPIDCGMDEHPTLLLQW